MDCVITFQDVFLNGRLVDRIEREGPIDPAEVEKATLAMMCARVKMPLSSYS